MKELRKGQSVQIRAQQRAAGRTRAGLAGGGRRIPLSALRQKCAVEGPDPGAQHQAFVRGELLVTVAAGCMLLSPELDRQDRSCGKFHFC